jgi:hypothetical protein
MDGFEESGEELTYNIFARPVVACVATAGVLLATGGSGNDLRGMAIQVGAGGASVLASDYIAGMALGGGGFLLSPALTGVCWGAIQKYALGNPSTPWLNLILTGGAIDMASGYLLDPVGRALGVV